MCSILGWRRDSRNPLKRQNIYDEFLKSKTKEIEKKWKTCKSLFQFLKVKSKKTYYWRKLENCKQNLKRTWDTIKQVIDKTKTFKNDIPKRMVINGFDTWNGFKKYFTEIGPNLASSTAASSKVFKPFMNVSKQCYRNKLFKIKN